MGRLIIESKAACKGKEAMIGRDEIFQYVRKKYNVAEDYPLPTAPTFPVMRHPDTRKWFAIIMDVPKDKLGLTGQQRVDVINVKLSDPLLVDVVTRQDGYFKGYHFNRGNWISILLDGTVPFEDICRWIDESFLVTVSKQRKQEYRPPKEWIIPANPKYYDTEHAFDEKSEIDWKQGTGIKTGDIVFMYVTAPVSAILYECRVTRTNIPYDYTDDHLTIRSIMKIELLERFKPDRFTFHVLKNEYGIYAVRGPRGVPYSLSEALKRGGDQR